MCSVGWEAWETQIIENAWISIHFHDFSIDVGSPIIENVLISVHLLGFLLWRGKFQIIENANISSVKWEAWEAQNHSTCWISMHSHNFFGRVGSVEAQNH